MLFTESTIGHRAYDAYYFRVIEDMFSSYAGWRINNALLYSIFLAQSFMKLECLTSNNYIKNVFGVIVYQI